MMAQKAVDIGECVSSVDVGETKSTTVTADVVSLSCRFCLNVDDNLISPKALPCSHVFCLPCLITDQEKNNITKCPICRHVTDMSLDKLPSVVKGEYKLLCDICVQDGVHDQYSKVYCTVCATKFCKKHELMHEEIHRSHDGHMIGMDDYKLRSRELEIRKCADHEDAVLNMGCRKCFKVICNNCWHANYNCSDDSRHDFMPLGALMKDLHTILDPLRMKAKEKDHQISELVKTTIDILSVWDSETEEMIKTLHKTRDEQIEAIRQEYTNIETGLRTNRDKAKDDITKYLDEEAGVKMDRLQTELLLFDAKLKDVHMVDLVTHHNQLEAKLRDLIEEEFPSLVLKNQLKLKTCDRQGMKRTKRSAEIDLVDRDDYWISIKTLPPKQIKLIREVTLESECITVCSYRGIVYVGLKDGSVIKVDSRGEKTVFAKLRNHVSSIRAYKHKIYILTTIGTSSDISSAYQNCTPYHAFVYNLEGTELVSWKHSEESSFFEGNKFTFSEDTVTIIDQAYHKLSVYSRTGQYKYGIDCPHVNCSSEVVICSGLSGSVIVSHRDCNEVFQLNMKTGEEEWICKNAITNPQGVARYGDKYLIVTNKKSDRTEIWILDIRTGKVIGTIREDQSRSKSSLTYDLFIEGNTLIIPRYEEKKVLFYNLA